ncbi:hypothetical protein PYV50_09530 [Pseudomonas sp. H22_DOA]|nr:hypothetical protein PYV50_09530 [Pseudomonas sp. H22_DOA]
MLDVIRLHPTLFPGRTEHARISLSLESGERLEMEFTGQFASTPTQDQDGHICLRQLQRDSHISTVFID